MTTREMPAADAAWLHMDRPNNLMVVNSVMLLGGPLERMILEKLLQERLVDRFPPFARRIASSHLPLVRPHWEDAPDFRVDDHIVEAEVDGDKGLQRYVGEHMSEPLDPTRPLWQTHLLHGAGPDGGSAIYCRMHHCIADGIALTRVMLSLTDEAEALGADRPTAPADHPPLAVQALTTAFDLVRHPSRLRDIAEQSPGVAASLAKELFTFPERGTALSGPNGLAKRAVWSAPVPLASIKDVAHRLGATVNDVMLAAVAGAVRRYLAERGSAIHDLSVMVPYNLRPEGEPLPPDLGNRFGLILVSLPVGVEDPAERVAEAHRRMGTIKSSPEAAVSYGVLQALGVSGPEIERRFVDFFAGKAGGVITNVPGPPERVTFAGVPIVRVIGWVPRSGNQAIGISIFSYAGEVTVGFSVDAGLVPDPEKLLDAFDEEIRALVTQE